MPRSRRIRFKSEGGTNPARRVEAIGHPRGAVVWGPAPFSRDAESRPWLVLNDRSYPFYGEEHLCVLLTTTERTAAIRLSPGEWVQGTPFEESFASPWVPMTLKAGRMQDRQGVVRTALVDRVAVELARYAGVEN